MHTAMILAVQFICPVSASLNRPDLFVLTCLQDMSKALALVEASLLIFPTATFHLASYQTLPLLPSSGALLWGFSSLTIQHCPLCLELMLFFCPGGPATAKNTRNLSHPVQTHQLLPVGKQNQLCASFLKGLCSNLHISKFQPVFSSLHSPPPCSLS